MEAGARARCSTVPCWPGPRTATTRSGARQPCVVCRQLRQGQNGLIFDIHFQISRDYVDINTATPHDPNPSPNPSQSISALPECDGPRVRVAGGGQLLGREEHHRVLRRRAEAGVRAARGARRGQRGQLRGAAAERDPVQPAGEAEQVLRPPAGRGEVGAGVRGVEERHPAPRPAHLRHVEQEEGGVELLRAQPRLPPPHRDVARRQRGRGEAAVGLRGRAAAQHLEPEALVVVADPAQRRGYPHPQPPRGHQRGEGVGPHHARLAALVVRVEGGAAAGVAAAAVGPLAGLRADLQPEADVAHVVRGVESLGRTLGLEAGHEARLAEVYLEEDVSAAPGLDLAVEEAPGGGRVVQPRVLGAGGRQRGREGGVRDEAGLQTQGGGAALAADQGA